MLSKDFTVFFKLGDCHFNDSTENEWKMSDVTPVFKKEKKTDPNKYRPVSLTSSSCKLLETMIRDDIAEHLEENYLLSKEQHGGSGLDILVIHSC